MESNFRTAWNLVYATYTAFQRSIPTLSDLNSILDYSSAGLGGITLHLMPSWCPGTTQTFSLPLEKRAAVSAANSLLFKVPERNWSKSKLGGILWSSPEHLLTFHDRDVDSSSPGPGDTAQPGTMGYGGTAAAGNHPCSEVKGKENFVNSVHAQM